MTSGSVVVLSDGADTGSQIGLAEAAVAARGAGVRVFSVGLRSGAFEPGPLEALAEGARGDYTEASTPADLAPDLRAARVRARQRAPDPVPLLRGATHGRAGAGARGGGGPGDRQLPRARPEPAGRRAVRAQRASGPRRSRSWSSAWRAGGCWRSRSCCSRSAPGVGACASGCAGSSHRRPGRGRQAAPQPARRARARRGGARPRAARLVAAVQGGARCRADPDRPGAASRSATVVGDARVRLDRLRRLREWPCSRSLPGARAARHPRVRALARRVGAQAVRRSAGRQPPGDRLRTCARDTASSGR